MTVPSVARRDERGAVATIVAVLFSAGVMLGVLALTVDVGRVVLERRELQNGADAGALALAQSCANAPCQSGGLWLKDLVNGNASDSDQPGGGHRIVGQCQRNSTGNLPGCPTGTGRLTDCAALPPGTPGGVSYVEVRTQTRSEGKSSLRNAFGGAAGGVSQSTVDACARAGWGPLKSAEVAPLSVSACVLDDAADGAIVLTPVTGSDADPCGPAASTWLDLGGSPCTAERFVGDTVVAGVKRADCLLAPQEVFLAVTGEGALSQSIVGFARFSITGVTGCAAAFPDEDCRLSGHFRQDVVLDGVIAPTTPGGSCARCLKAVQLLG